MGLKLLDRHKLNSRGDFEKGIEQFLSEEWHFVYEWIGVAALVEDKDWSGVVVSHAFCFVVIVVDAVEIYLRMIERTVLCEFLVFSSEFFAAVAMGGIVVNHLIPGLISDLFILFSNYLLCIGLFKFLALEVLGYFVFLAILQPMMQLLQLTGLTGTQRKLILESTCQSLLYYFWVHFCVFLVGLEAGSRIVIILIKDGSLLDVISKVQSFWIFCIFWLRKFLINSRYQFVSAIPVDIYIDDEVSRVQYPLHWRKNKDIVEVAIRDIDICVSFAVNAEETCIFFELLPQVRTLTHQEVNLIRVIRFQTEQSSCLIVLDNKLLNVFGLCGILLFKLLQYLDRIFSFVVLLCSRIKRNIIAINIHRPQLLMNILQAYFFVTIQTFNQPFHQWFGIELQMCLFL